MCFLPFQWPSEAVRHCIRHWCLSLPYGIHFMCVQQLTKWTMRHAQCSAVSQSVSQQVVLLTLCTVALLCQAPLQSTSAQPGGPVILAPTVCFKLIHFIFYVFTYFSARNSCQLCVVHLCSFCAPLWNAPCFRWPWIIKTYSTPVVVAEVWSERNTSALFVEVGRVLLRSLFVAIFRRNFTDFIVRTDLYGTYWSLWYVLIFMVLTDLYGTYWSLWYVQIFMVRTDLYDTYWSLWYVLIFMIHADLYGTYWSLWYILIYMVHTDLYGTYWSLWYLLIL